MRFRKLPRHLQATHNDIPRLFLFIFVISIELAFPMVVLQKIPGTEKVPVLVLSMSAVLIMKILAC